MHLSHRSRWFLKQIQNISLAKLYVEILSNLNWKSYNSWMLVRIGNNENN